MRHLFHDQLEDWNLETSEKYRQSRFIAALDMIQERQQINFMCSTFVQLEFMSCKNEITTAIITTENNIMSDDELYVCLCLRHSNCYCQIARNYFADSKKKNCVDASIFLQNC